MNDMLSFFVYLQEFNWRGKRRNQRNSHALGSRLMSLLEKVRAGEEEGGESEENTCRGAQTP